MQEINGNTGGWQSIKAFCRRAAKRINALQNVRIVRSGNTDTATFSDNGWVLNLRKMAEGGGGGAGSGLSFRQFTGGIAISGDDEPTTTEYQTALTQIYTDNDTTPQFGDLISLRVSGGSRLIARFWVLEDDEAATNATVAFTVDGTQSVALNISYVPLEQIIDAIQDYIADPDGGQQPDGRDIEPEGGAPFAISVNGLYDTSEDGFLIPSVGNPVIAVNGGDVQPTDDIDATASSVSDSSYSFPSSDGITYVHLYLKVSLSLAGPNDTPSSATASIESRTTGSAGVPAVSETSIVSNQAVKYFTIGVVALASRGNRRFARITQTFAGDLKVHAEGTGSNTPDINGVNKAAGPRKVTLCINGALYETHIITTELKLVQ